MNGSEILNLLKEWYKPTKKGEEARQILSSEAGTVGDKTDKKKAQH